MKKTFLSVGLCVLFLLFSGCIHGSLDISIPDGITTRMDGDQNYTWYFFNDAIHDDTVSGTFIATSSSSSCTFNVTEAILTYTIEDSASVKKNYRDYSFEIKGTNSSDGGDITLTIDLTLSAKEYGYDEFRGESFIFNKQCEGTAGETTYTVDPDCVFNRKTDY